MHVKPTLLASAILAAFAPLPFAPLAFAQTVADTPIATVVVTASAFKASEADQIFTPAKVLAGDELRSKLGSSLGETLSNELGVSASAFGAGASRPIIRGLEGNRVKVLENGMAVSDLSGLSNDHAVSGEAATARQIEILRGPAALLYGSGAIGGLVNVVNERIPTEHHEHASGVAEMRYNSVDHGRSVSFSGDTSAGKVALHVDGSGRDAGDYHLPGDVADTFGRETLPDSALRQHTLGFGASYIGERGHIGASVSSLDKEYGIPGSEGARIDLGQTRYDIDSQLQAPLPGFDQLRFKVGYNDYGHVELNAEGEPETLFSNRALETRLELKHKPVAGWSGSFGVQTEHARFSGLSAESGEPATVPTTVSDTRAAFLVEERAFGVARVNAGVRLESVKREPDNAARFAPARSFDLLSYSAGTILPLAPGYTVGLTASVAQRAPAADELYSGGPHESTLTFDIGNPNFKKETSRNIELSFRKTTGLVRWQANLFQNSVRDFIYGEVSDTLLDDDGTPDAEQGELRERIFRQADATIRGVEAEISYNQQREGLSLRAFGDMSRGRLDDAGSLPLQPAKRVGAEAGYKRGPLQGGVSLLRALKQERLAAFESTPTPAYTQLDANLSYTQRFAQTDLTWFLIARNLLDDEIRVSTSVLKDVAPLPGRNITVGVRAAF